MFSIRRIKLCAFGLKLLFERFNFYRSQSRDAVYLPRADQLQLKQEMPFTHRVRSNDGKLNKSDLPLARSARMRERKTDFARSVSHLSCFVCILYFTCYLLYSFSRFLPISSFLAFGVRFCFLCAARSNIFSA